MLLGCIMFSRGMLLLCVGIFLADLACGRLWVWDISLVQYVKAHPGSDFGQHSLIPELWFCGSCMHTSAYDVFLAVAIGIHIGPEIWSIEC